MKISAILTLVSTSLLAMSATAHGIYPVVHLGYEFGGDELATVVRDDGSKGNLSVNEGLSIGLGLSFPLSESLELQSSLGYVGKDEEVNRGDASWRSFPWESSIIAYLGHFSVGGGVVYHFSPTLDSSGALSDIGKIEFGDALGVQAQIAYSLMHGDMPNDLEIGVKHTTIDFVTEETTVVGDSTAVFLKYYF